MIQLRLRLASIPQLYKHGSSCIGGIPESLALHEALESLDVSGNRLSELPAGFLNAPSTARIEASPLRNLKLSRNLFTVNPKTYAPPGASFVRGV